MNSITVDCPIRRNGAEVQGPGWVNHEWQNYTGNRQENARVGNGVLTIEARRDWFGGHEISSARLKTSYKGDWLNGRIEVRAKLPAAGAPGQRSG